MTDTAHHNVYTCRLAYLSYGLCVTTGGTSEGSNIGAGADLWVECCSWNTMLSGA